MKNRRTLNNTNLDPNQKDCLNIIKYSTENLIGLIDNILDYSNIDNITFNNKSFNFHELIMNIRNISLPYINHICINIEKDIPFLLIGDKIRINQIIMNMIRYLINHIDEGDRISINCSINYIDMDWIDILFQIHTSIEQLDKIILNTDDPGLRISKKLIELNNSICIYLVVII